MGRAYDKLQETIKKWKICREIVMFIQQEKIDKLNFQLQSASLSTYFRQNALKNKCE